MDQLPGQGRVRNVTPQMQETARTLRREMTPAEQALWQALCGKQIDGLRFRRQHAVGTVSFDFYCPACRLVIEVDGSVHDAPDVAERDSLRQKAIEAFGYRVLRFRNEEVLTNLPAVLGQIRTVVRQNG